ncbi:MAG: F0F1 ATP synthase subunit epsilon [Prevotellaceae bacterium]|jgi:F-type H+-transporting ATPase subunit epsilon|nr:F0F1 ATP synthase subunit epsilon [Prevotellaceae bacterium]
MNIQIVSPAGTLYEGALQYAVFPGHAGEFAIYPAHAPLISMLAKGAIKCVTEEGKNETIPVGGGFVEVNGNKITVCVEQ